MTQKRNQKMISVGLSKEDYDQLKKESEKTGYSMAAIVRKSYLDSKEIRKSGGISKEELTEMLSAISGPTRLPFTDEMNRSLKPLLTPGS